MARLTVSEPERLAVLAAATLDVLDERARLAKPAVPSTDALDTFEAHVADLGTLAKAILDGDRAASTQLAGRALVDALVDGGEHLRRVAKRILAGDEGGGDA